MKREAVAATALIFLGSIVCVFFFNLFLYAMVPGYRNLLLSAVARHESVPVMEAPAKVKETPLKIKETPVEEKKMTLEELKQKYDISGIACKNDEFEGEAEPTIVDKTYYEDCGTARGYWVITYSDGSTAVE